MGLLNNFTAGMGKALESIGSKGVDYAFATGLEGTRAQLLKERDVLANQFATERQRVSEEGADRRLGVTEAGADRRLAVTDAGADRRLGVTEGGADRRLGVTEGGADRRQGVSEAGADRRQAAALASSEKLAALSNGIAAGHLSLAKERDKIDNELKTITLNNTRQVETLRKEYVNPATSAERRAVIHDTVQLLTGKDNDNIVPLPEKDALGNTTYSKALNRKTGKIISLTPEGGEGGIQIGKGADAGKVMVDGVVIPGTATTPAEIRALVAKYKASKGAVAPEPGLLNSGGASGGF